MLKADDLIAPSNLLLAVESTFKWHHDAVCAWAAQKGARPANVGTNERPSIMDIINEWETTPELQHVFGEMVLWISKRAE